MVNLNTQSDISGYMQAIYEDAMFVARENNFMTALVWVPPDRTTDEAKTRVSSNYNQGTAQSVGESDDLTSSAFTPSTDQTLTPAEVGIQFFLTDKRISVDPMGGRADAAQELGMAISDNVESALLGDFSSLTGGTVGAAGTTITWGYFFAALTILKAQKASPPYMCVLHPYQYHSLGKAASIAAITQPVPTTTVDDVMRRWWVSNVVGVDIYVTSNLSVNSSDDAYGAMFSRQAIAYDPRRAPRLEPERDASRRGWELNMTHVYAHGVWRPTFGVQMLFDATAPTS